MPSSVKVGGSRTSRMQKSNYCARAVSMTSVVSGGRDHLVAIVFEEPNEPLTKQDRVLADQDAHRTLTSSGTNENIFKKELK